MALNRKMLNTKVVHLVEIVRFVTGLIFIRDRGNGVPSFGEMVAIVLEKVDFDDPTTNVRGRRALAIAKLAPRGY